jgi:hypothetical protein
MALCGSCGRGVVASSHPRTRRNLRAFIEWKLAHLSFLLLLSTKQSSRIMAPISTIP